MALRGILTADGRKRSWTDYVSKDEPGDLPKSIKLALYKGFEEERKRWVSVTTLLYCLRKAKWEYEEDFYLPQQNAYYFMRGNLIHGILSFQDKDDVDSIIETDFSRPVPGTKLNLNGRIDKYSQGILYDYKTMSDNGIYTLIKGGVKEEHAWQGNMYRWLLKSHDIEVKEIRIVYVMMRMAIQTGDTFFVEDKKSRKLQEHKLPPCPIYPDDKVESFLIPKFKLLESGGLPPANPQEWMCNTCYFRERCNKITSTVCAAKVTNKSVVDIDNIF